MHIDHIVTEAGNGQTEVFVAFPLLIRRRGRSIGFGFYSGKCYQMPIILVVERAVGNLRQQNSQTVTSRSWMSTITYASRYILSDLDGDAFEMQSVERSNEMGDLLLAWVRCQRSHTV